MTSIRLNPFVRGTTWLLVAAFLLASLPGGAFAQDVPAVDARARERIAQFRAARAGQPPASAADGEAPAFSAQSSEAGESSLETSTTTEGETLYQLKLSNASLDVLLDEYYAPLTGRTMIKAPGVAGTFNFKAREKLTKAEMIQAMDSLLSMNNLALVPLGERFFRVVQIDKAPTEGLAIQRDGLPAGPDSDALVSQLIPLKYLEMEDANTIVQSMLHGFGKVQRFDRISSLLVTETATNLRRIHEILELVDQPTELKVETRVYEIKHAKASEIAARLNELVSDSQGEKKEEVAQVAQPAAAVRRPAGMIRARPAVAPEPAPAADSAAALEAAMAEKGILSGKVKVLADERTNIIIVISRPSNFTFFDKIVAVLDRPVDPEVVVQVVALEFADAEEMAGLLNDFIGAAKSETDKAAPAAAADSADGRARALEDFVRARAAAADRVRQAAGEEAASKIGQLSASTKILADKRTNTLLLMGTKGDIAALQDVVKKVDIMLAQVLIEAVILEVNLNNNVAYGVNWLQKSMTAYSQRTAGANGGVSLREPVASWGGAFGNQNFGSAAGDTITRASASALNSGLSYFFTFADLNIDMVLDMVASSGEGRVLATPVILTTDNTEAEIMSGQQIPIRTGDTTSGGTIQSDYEYKDVGIQLKVKPRINPSRYVTLEITQSADTLGDPVDVGNNGKMYAINKREMTASISVPSRSTIVLGGLVQTDYQNLNTRVPILGSIPVLGSLFRSEDTTRKRTELLVLITPYVLMTPGEAREETERLHRASNVAAEDWYRGWSDSSLAPFSPQKLRELELSERRAEKEAHRARVQVPNAPDSAPPVALIAPAAAAAEPAAAPAPAPLPAPEEPTPTAPFAFDPAVPAEPAEPPAPAPEKSAKKSRRKAEEAKPSMFAAPEAAPAPAANGGAP
ncbi:MAG TPA: type II secretion system secretin GspD [Kiritimatiellia bacterium]|nr:type II secretion system secretin GspD [Kiritimatiellia bacterium]